MGRNQLEPGAQLRPRTQRPRYVSLEPRLHYISSTSFAGRMLQLAYSMLRPEGYLFVAVSLATTLLTSINTEYNVFSASASLRHEL